MTWLRFDIDLLPEERHLFPSWPQYSRIVWVQGLSEEEATLWVRQACLDLAREQMVQPEGEFYVEVAPRLGVTCPEADALLEVARWLGLFHADLKVAVGARYRFLTAPSQAEIKALFNPLLERASLNAPLGVQVVLGQEALALPEVIGLQDLSDEELAALSQDRRLSLSLEEMLAVRAHFAALGREPNALELEMIAQTWSEHCVHKTFRAHIELTEHFVDGTSVISVVDDMLKQWLWAPSAPHFGDWVLSAFKDNAGIVRVGEGPWTAALKMETHNHPSALDPFGGAHTGVGGVIRDILGVSARPIANWDVLCFGLPESQPLPSETRHAAASIRDGVIAGVGDYGNQMGLATVAGAIRFDPAFERNPLVFCGTLGLGHQAAYPHEVQTGDLIVVVGGRTGRDGLKGATFSSFEMDSDSAAHSGGAVQLGYPQIERQVALLLEVALAEGLYHAVTDCGAGGFSSAVGELGQELGAKVELANALTKYAGLSAWELWLSESQERMVLAVPPHHLKRLEALGQRFSCEVYTLGHFGHHEALHPQTPPEAAFRIEAKGQLAGLLSTTFLKEGLPQRRLKAHWQQPAHEADLPASSFEAQLHARLTHRDRLTRQEVYRGYDHEVGGATWLKPVLGWGQSLSPLSILYPRELREAQAPMLALSSVLNPKLGQHDPQAMAFELIAEALSHLIAAGAHPNRMALLDNFAWGSLSNAQQLGSLVRCVKACGQASSILEAPFVSGKDSLNNAWRDSEGRLHSILPTLVITALGQVLPEDVVKPYLDQPDLDLWLWGTLGPTLRSQADIAELRQHHLRLSHTLKASSVRACRALGQAGLWESLCEMALASPKPLGVALEASALEALGPWQLGFERSPLAFVLALPKGASLPEGLAGALYLGRSQSNPVLSLPSLAEFALSPASLSI